MHRYLIVANRSLGGQQLRERVRGLVRAGPATFHVLVPVAPDAPAAQRAQRDRAERALALELGRLSGLGAQVTGEVVAADPYDAVLHALRRQAFDEVLVCTLPLGLSRWLRADLVHRLERDAGVPVTHIVAPAGLHERMSARAVRLTIYLGESDHHGHVPLYTEIVRRARAAGLAGATVLRGVEGFGASNVIHTTRLLTMSEDLPMIVVIVDTPERIDPFLSQLDEMLTAGLVVREEVEVLAYAPRRP